MNTRLKKTELSLLILIGLLPFHYILFDIIFDIKLLKIWKEILVVGIFLTIIWQLYNSVDERKPILKNNKKKIVNGIRLIFRKIYEDKLGLMILVTWLFFFVLIVVSPIKGKAIGMARVYIVPMMLYFITKNYSFSSRFKKTMYNVLAISSMIIFIYGVIQQFILGPQFLLDIGYRFNMYRGYPRLPASFYLTGMGFGDFQRFASVFVSPNTAGLYLSIVFTLLLNLKISGKKYINDILLTISLLATGLSVLLTFSRSSWVALLCSIFISYLVHTNFTKKRVMRDLLIVSLMFLVLIVFDVLFLKSKFITIFFQTITLQDTSIVGHIVSLKDSVQVVLGKPFGLGLGRNGPRALAYMAHPNLTESSYFLLGYEIGILGALVYFLMIVSSIYMAFKQRKNSESLFKYSYISIAIVVLLGFITLPYIQELEVTMMLFIFMGLAFNNVEKA